MNAEDCLAGASPEVRRLTAECVQVIRPILEGKLVGATLEAVCRAVAIVATSCATDGYEGVVVLTAANIIRRLVPKPLTKAVEDGGPVSRQVLN